MRAVTVLCMLLAVPVYGQTVESVVDLSALGWGELSMPRAIETDGDLSTREWLVTPLVQTYPDPLFRVVALRDGAICASAWFSVTPEPNVPRYVEASVQRVGAVDKLVVRQGASPLIYLVALETPHCTP